MEEYNHVMVEQTKAPVLQQACMACLVCRANMSDYLANGGHHYCSLHWAMVSSTLHHQ